jgi:hypothetical protein
MNVDLPHGWIQKVSRSQNRIYYVNEYTKESQWEKPEEPAQPTFGFSVYTLFNIPLLNHHT